MTLVWAGRRVGAAAAAAPDVGAERGMGRASGQGSKGVRGRKAKQDPVLSLQFAVLSESSGVGGSGRNQGVRKGLGGAGAPPSQGKGGAKSGISAAGTKRGKRESKEGTSKSKSKGAGLAVGALGSSVRSSVAVREAIAGTLIEVEGRRSADAKRAKAEREAARLRANLGYFRNREGGQKAQVRRVKGAIDRAEGDADDAFLASMF